MKLSKSAQHMAKPATDLCRRIAMLSWLTPEQAHVIAHDAQALRHAHILKAAHKALRLLPALPKAAPHQSPLSQQGCTESEVRHIVC